MNLKFVGMTISVILITCMIFITIKTNFSTNNSSNELADYPSGLIEDLPSDLDDSNLDSEFGLEINKRAPNFELVTLSGDTVRLSDYKGQRVVLNFWASWCPPCRFEMPHMENYYQKYKDLEDVEILAVNMTTMERGSEEKTDENIAAFIDKYQLTFPVPLDEDGRVMDLYKVMDFPTTYFINTEGIITDKVRRAVDDILLKELVENSH